MNDEQQRARRNNYIMGDYYDRWKLMSREDEEDERQAREDRQNLLDEKSDYLETEGVK